MRRLFKLFVAFGFCLALIHPASAADTASDLPKEIIANGVEFVLVPEGWFHYAVYGAQMRDGKLRYRPRREIKVWADTMYIGKFEARARDFTRFMNSGEARHVRQYYPPPEAQSDAYGAYDGCAVRVNDQGTFYERFPDNNLPATNLSWDLANEFAAWMGFRLPTDAEWVHAFRGSDKRRYPWGDEFPDDTHAAFQEGATACNMLPVDSHPKGRSPYGAYSMAGNAFEYVADWSNHLYEGTLEDGVRNPFAAEPFAAPKFDNERHGQLRGGRWASGADELSMIGNRETQRHDDAFICYGTRFALSADKAREYLASGKAQAVAP